MPRTLGALPGEDITRAGWPSPGDLLMHGVAIRFWNYAVYCGAIAAAGGHRCARHAPGRAPQQAHGHSAAAPDRAAGLNGFRFGADRASL
ncbi:hypothetical protein ACWGID_14780 [Kribbella sp. NPDC054772]